MNDFSKALRKVRKSYFGKQLALADACSCSVPHISWLEGGKRCPSCAMLQKLRQALIAAHVGEREIAELMRDAKAEIIQRRFGSENAVQL